MATLTEKQESLTGSIVLVRVSAHGAGLRGVVGVHFHGHAALQESFVGDHALQLRKRPRGLTSVGLALFLRRFLALLAFGALADICQVFQSNDGMWVLFHNAFTHHMIGVLLQPSLSLANLHRTARSGTSAFFLKTLSQSCVVVGFGNHGFSGMKSWLSFHGATDSEITHPDIDPNYTGVGLRCGRVSLDLQGHEQVELLLGFLVAELSRSNLSSILDKGDKTVE
jgi:hypothetical protein